jgi:hypothetical protein
VIIDIPSATEIWRWPAPDAATSSQKGFVSFGGQFEKDLRGVRVFEFTSDGKGLVVGDGEGGVGVYELGEVEVGEGAQGTGGLERYELGTGEEVAWVDVVDQEIGRVRREEVI